MRINGHVSQVFVNAVAMVALLLFFIFIDASFLSPLVYFLLLFAVTHHDNTLKPEKME